MTATLILWNMRSRRSRPKISDGEFVHISNYLPVSKVHAELSVAYQRREGDHGERCGAPIVEFEVDNLVIADIIVAFVDTLAEGTRFQGFGYVFDIGDTVDNSRGRPSFVASGYGIEINCERINTSYGAKGEICSPFLALYGHVFSIGQSIQRVAAPASTGLADLLKCCNDPNDDTRVGVDGESQWQMMSISLSLYHLARLWFAWR